MRDNLLFRGSDRFFFFFNENESSGFDVILLFFLTFLCTNDSVKGELISLVLL